MVIVKATLGGSYFTAVDGIPFIVSYHLIRTFISTKVLAKVTLFVSFVTFAFVPDGTIRLYCVGACLTVLFVNRARRMFDAGYVAEASKSTSYTFMNRRA